MRILNDNDLHKLCIFLKSNGVQAKIADENVLISVLL